jgi:riboflavin kinase/FMN adenylyltransferase
VWVTSSLQTVLTPTAIALGNFDGVHRGHQRVIQPVLVGPNQQFATVVTFHPHPQEFFSGRPRSLLTPLEEKVMQLKGLGVDQLVLLPFDRELADLNPSEFVNTLLVRSLQAKHICIGEDFRFGRHRAGTAKDLRAIAQTHGIEVEIIPLQTQDGERISSSGIRAALQVGQVDEANRLLGRAYSLVGTVVKGRQLGRKLGFPTANLHLPTEKFLPQLGVYYVQVEAETLRCTGLMNLGLRPTVDAEANPTVEVHLLDWAGDLYDQVLTVKLIAFLRPERQFPSLEALKEQILADCQAARQIFAKNLSKTAVK